MCEVFNQFFLKKKSSIKVYRFHNSFKMGIVCKVKRLYPKYKLPLYVVLVAGEAILIVDSEKFRSHRFDVHK